MSLFIIPLNNCQIPGWLMARKTAITGTSTTSILNGVETAISAVQRGDVEFLSWLDRDR